MINSLYGSESFFQKLPVVQILRKFPSFYMDHWFITAFTNAPTTGSYPDPHESGPHPLILISLIPILLLSHVTE